MNDGAIKIDDRVAPAARRFDAGLRVVRGTALPSRGEIGHFWSLTMTMTRSELKQRYFGSALGYLWTLLRPLLLFGVLYVVFTHIVRLGAVVKDYPLYLLMCLVLWNYFAETTSAGVTSLVAREGIMRKINFPRFAVPLALAMTTGFHLILNMLVVIVFIVASGITPDLGWLAAVPLVLAVVVLSIGVSMLLSTLYVNLRDLGPIWEVFTQLLFWGSPIIYVADYPQTQWLRQLLAANPLSSIFTELRHLVIDASAPTASQVIGGDVYLLIPVAVVVVSALLGFWIFKVQAPSIAEDL